jgi:hypothetical protein
MNTTRTAILFASLLFLASCGGDPVLRFQPDPKMHEPAAIDGNTLITAASGLQMRLSLESLPIRTLSDGLKAGLILKNTGSQAVSIDLSGVELNFPVNHNTFTAFPVFDPAKGSRFDIPAGSEVSHTILFHPENSPRAYFRFYYRGDYRDRYTLNFSNAAALPAGLARHHHFHLPGEAYAAYQAELAFEPRLIQYTPGDIVPLIDQHNHTRRHRNVDKLIEQQKLGSAMHDHEHGHGEGSARELVGKIMTDPMQYSETSGTAAFVFEGVTIRLKLFSLDGDYYLNMEIYNRSALGILADAGKIRIIAGEKTFDNDGYQGEITRSEFLRDAKTYLVARNDRFRQTLRFPAGKSAVQELSLDLSGVSYDAQKETVLPFPLPFRLVPTPAR